MSELDKKRKIKVSDLSVDDYVVTSEDSTEMKPLITSEEDIVL